MAESSISTSDLPSYVLVGLFDSFGEETKMMFETTLMNLATKLTVTVRIFLIDTQTLEMMSLGMLYSVVTADHCCTTEI